MKQPRLITTIKWHNPRNVSAGALKDGERFLVREEVEHRLPFDIEVWWTADQQWHPPQRHNHAYNNQTFKTTAPLPSEYSHHQIEQSDLLHQCLFVLLKGDLRAWRIAAFTTAPGGEVTTITADTESGGRRHGPVSLITSFRYPGPVPFDLKRALDGEEVTTRDGRPVKDITMDEGDANLNFPVQATRPDHGYAEITSYFRRNGGWSPAGNEHPNDLVMKYSTIKPAAPAPTIESLQAEIVKLTTEREARIVSAKDTERQLIVAQEWAREYEKTAVRLREDMAIYRRQVAMDANGARKLHELELKTRQEERDELQGLYAGALTDREEALVSRDKLQQLYDSGREELNAALNRVADLESHAVDTQHEQALTVEEPDVVEEMRSADEIHATPHHLLTSRERAELLRYIEKLVHRVSGAAARELGFRNHLCQLEDKVKYLQGQYPHDMRSMTDNNERLCREVASFKKRVEELSGDKASIRWERDQLREGLTVLSKELPAIFTLAINTLLAKCQSQNGK